MIQSIGPQRLPRWSHVVTFNRVCQNTNVLAFPQEFKPTLFRNPLSVAIKGSLRTGRVPARYCFVHIITVKNVKSGRGYFLILPNQPITTYRYILY